MKSANLTWMKQHMYPRLVSNNLKSSTLKRLADELSTLCGRKIWRAKTPRINKLNLTYGDCRDKIYQYKWFEENQVQSIPFTVNKEVAKQWLQEGDTVFARTLITASEGRGIAVLESLEQAETVSAPVFTLYIPKKYEYRVHIFKDQVVAILEKRKRKGVTSDSKIRNTANGYVFCRENVEIPEGIKELALKARKVTKSDFVGVDIGYNVKRNLLFVIECNSAPGIEGTNINDYCNEIIKHV